MALRYTVRWVISKNKKLREAPEREPLVAWLNRSSTARPIKIRPSNRAPWIFEENTIARLRLLGRRKGDGEASGSGVVVKLEIASFTVHAWLIAMANARILPGFSHRLYGTEGTRSPESKSRKAGVARKTDYRNYARSICRFCADISPSDIKESYGIFTRGTEGSPPCLR